MAFEALPIVGYAMWIASASIPISVARRSGTLYATDFALLLSPAFAFLVALLIFNSAALTGWAFAVYPVLLLSASVVALHVRVFLLPRLGAAPRASSRWSLLTAVGVAVALGAFIPPLYE